MTEDEAKTKWCPQTKYVSNEIETASNRWSMDISHESYNVKVHGTPENPKLCRCIASDCMMWICTWEKMAGDNSISRDESIGRCGLTNRG